MKKILCLLFVFVLSLPLFATKERRVYYLDCSYSMVRPNKIWTIVCDNLINAIENVDDVTTELYVVPFAFDGQDRDVLDAYVEYATPEGKEALKKKIRAIKPSTKSMTYHSNPISDFYFNNRVCFGRDVITYMFLMTDGENQHPNKDKFPNLLKEWEKRCGNNSVYGFYVMLNSKARNPIVSDIIKAQENLWEVETADVNINLIRLENGCVFNARDNEEFVDIPVSGKINNIDLKVCASNEYYVIDRCEKQLDGVRVFLTSQQSLSLVPEEIDLPISIDMEKAGDFDFLLTENIVVRCENKHVDAINPTFNQGKKIEKLGQVKYYPKFWWSEEKTEPLTVILQLQPSSDAKTKDCFAEFEFVDKDGKLIPSDELRISVNDNTLERNRFRVNCSECDCKITFEYLPTAKDGKHQGYLRLVSHNLDRCGNEDLSYGKSVNALCWQIDYDKCMNPLAKCVLIFVVAVLGALLLWFIVFCPIIYPRFGSAQKTFTAPGMAPLIVKFKGARQIVISATPQKKQSVWNRLWTGKIVYKVHPAFTFPIAFKPSKGKRILTKYPIGTYQVMPNPIPYVGTATIIDIAKNVKINVN